MRHNHKLPVYCAGIVLSNLCTPLAAQTSTITQKPPAKTTVPPAVANGKKWLLGKKGG